MARTPSQMPSPVSPGPTCAFEHAVNRTKHDNADVMCVDFEEYLVSTFDMAEFQRRSDAEETEDAGCLAALKLFEKNGASASMGNIFGARILHARFATQPCCRQQACGVSEQDCLQ